MNFKLLSLLCAALFVFSTRSAISQGTDAIDHRVCVDFDVARDEYTFVRIGYYPVVRIPQYMEWYIERAGRHWVLRVPKLSVGVALSAQASILERNDATLEYYYSNGKLVPWVPVIEQIGRHERSEPIPPERCHRYENMSKETAHSRRTLIQVSSNQFALSRKVQPSFSTGRCEDDGGGRKATRRPELDFDGFEACTFESVRDRGTTLEHTAYHRASDSEPFIIRCSPIHALFCSVESSIHGWPIRVTFMPSRMAEWRSIWSAAEAYLKRATITYTEASTD